MILTSAGNHIYKMYADSLECKTTLFLGVTIDYNLSWKPHIQNVCSKLSKCMGIMYKAKHVLPKSAMVSLYYTLTYPYLMYCNEVWGCIQESKLQKLTIIQKKIIRIITNAHYLEHTNTMFDELEKLKLADINKYISSVFMYKYENKYLSKCFVGTFTKNQEVHHYNTRFAPSL